MYTSPNFKTSWNEWKQHKEQKYGSPYTEVAEQKALSALFKRTHGIEQLAIDSIDYSIENNWSAIYLKPRENGQSASPESKQEFRSSVQDELTSRLSRRG